MLRVTVVFGIFKCDWTSLLCYILNIHNQTLRVKFFFYINSTLKRANDNLS